MSTAQEAARQRAAAHNRTTLIGALHAERQGYVQRGLQGRVREVDAQLEKLGAPAQEPDPEAAAKAKAEPDPEAAAKAKAEAEAEAAAKAKAEAEAEAAAKAKAEAPRRRSAKDAIADDADAK